MPRGFRVEGGKELAKLVRNIEKYEPLLRKELRERLKAAAETVAQDARAEIAPTSQTVANSIIVEVKLGKTKQSVAVVAKGSRMPEGHEALPDLLEGRQGRRDGFRHPVFGTDTWVTQPTHPFIAPSAQKREAETTALITDAFEAVRKSLGEK
jgi:hypothetical protein